MVDKGKLKIQNDGGAGMIMIGARQFQCTGATPPQDHPHIYLDMGAETEITCPYCSTLYVHNLALAPGASEPADAAYAE